MVGVFLPNVVLVRVIKCCFDNHHGLVECRLETVKHDVKMFYRAVPHGVVAQSDDVVIEFAVAQFCVVSLSRVPVLGVLRMYYYLCLGTCLAAGFHPGVEECQQRWPVVGLGWLNPTRRPKHAEGYFVAHLDEVRLRSGLLQGVQRVEGMCVNRVGKYLHLFVLALSCNGFVPCFRSKLLAGVSPSVRVVEVKH